jgi:CBS domain-containing protein
MPDPLDTQVETVMSSPIRTVDGDVSARDVAGILVQEDIGSVVVEVSTGSGILTKTDLVAGIDESLDPDRTTVADLMTSPVITVTPDADVQTVIDRMEANGIKRLVVEENGAFVGIVTVTDLAEAFAVDLDTVIGMFV